VTAVKPSMTISASLIDWKFLTRTRTGMAHPSLNYPEGLDV
jgi:hypothetical protein